MKHLGLVGRITHRSRLSALWCAWALLIAAPAHAEDPTSIADDLFNAGRAAYQRGEFSAAGRAFDEAGRKAPRSQTSYNAGVAWEAAGDAVRAANAFKAALTLGGLPANLAQDAEQRRARLAMPLGEISVEGPAGVSVEVAGLRDNLPFSTYEPPGNYAVSIEYAGGSREVREVRVEPGQIARLLVSEPASALPTRSAGVASPVAAPPVAHREPTRGAGFHTTAGIAALGVAGIASGAGLALGIRGLAARDRFDASGHTDADARSAALSLRTGANVALGAALLFSIGGVVLLFERPHRASATGFVGVGPSSLTLGGIF